MSFANAGVAATPTADFAPRRILLHVPTAHTSTLVFLGPLPPTREGSEFEDVLLASALGGDDKSVLFDAVRTGLRASYGFGTGFDAYTRDLRALALSGEVETAKLAEAETIVRAAYSQFLTAPKMGDLTAHKEPLKANGEQTATLPGAASYSTLMAIVDGQDANLALTLPSLLGHPLHHLSKYSILFYIFDAYYTSEIKRLLTFVSIRYQNSIILLARLA